MSNTTNLAAYLSGPKSNLEISSAPLYDPQPGEVVIKNEAIAIQPLDAKTHNANYGGMVKSFPFILGTSLAGTIHAVGEGVEGLKVNDRVVADTAAYTAGDRRMGSWQRYAVAKSRTVAKIGNASFKQAVAISFPLQTAVAALHLYLGMGKPGTGRVEDKVLIWGAGGAVGAAAVQYAKSVGHTVIVTASPRDINRQKSLGASEVVDYKAPDVVSRLRELGPYKYLFTASGDANSQHALGSILQPSGGVFASVLGGDIELPQNVKRVYAAFSMAAQNEDFAEFAVWWYGEYVPKALGEGLVQPPAYVERGGGLAALQEASQDVFEPKVREKIVINPQEG